MDSDIILFQYFNEKNKQTLDFETLPTFKHSITGVDFSTFLKGDIYWFVPTVICFCLAGSLVFGFIFSFLFSRGSYKCSTLPCCPARPWYLLKFWANNCVYVCICKFTACVRVRGCVSRGVYPPTTKALSPNFPLFPSLPHSPFPFPSSPPPPLILPSPPLHSFLPRSGPIETS